MVTSRATGDDLVEDEDEDAQSADITAPPRQSARKPAAAKPDSAKPDSAKPAPADETQDVPAKNAPARDAKANGDSAAKGAARPAPADATVVDGIPAFPADTIGSSRGAKVPDPEPVTTSFGPPPSAPAKPALEDPTIAYPAETAAKPFGDTTAATSASSPVSSSPVSSGSASAGSASSGTSSAAPPATEASSMPPAAFAWEMPDPPADSPSSPARAFLRSGLTAKNPAPASSATKTAPPAPAGKPAATEPPVRGPAKSGPVTFGQSRSGPAKGGSGPKGQQKAQQKAQSKKSARQAHLTIARVEPWSVMKFSFVVSLVAFVILFVAVSVLYGALSGLGVFDSLQRVVTSLTSSQGSTGVNAKA